MKAEKKSERIEVRVGFDEKSAFVDACDSQGDTPSSALRRFIRGYVRRADADWRSSAWRGAMSKHRVIGALGAGALGAAVLLVMIGSFGSAPDRTSNDTVLAAMEAYEGVWPKPETVSARCYDQPDYAPALQCALFVRYDRDGDGVLHPGDILPSDGPLFKVLDLNGDGITLREFWGEGRMDYTISDTVEVEIDANGFPKIKARSTRWGYFGWPDTGMVKMMVAFDLRGDQPVINSFAPESGNIMTRRNRSVYWETDKAEAVFTGQEDAYQARKAVREDS